MNITIKALGVEPFPISNEIPKGLSRYVIPGSKVLSAVASFGQFMIQLAELDESTWLYYIFTIKEAVTLLLSYFAPLILARISLKGQFNYETYPFNYLLIKENQCSIIYRSEASSKLHLEEGDYILFETTYPQNTVFQTLMFFPAFEEFKTSISQSRSASLSKQVICLSPSIADCIYKIIHSPFSENLLQFHQNTVNDLLVAVLKEAASLQPCDNKFTIDEVERIYAARAFIEAHIPIHYSIGHIARHVGMNEKKLKYGFKEVIGIGLYGYFLDRVLEVAKIEVEQTKRSVKQIAQHTGYKNGNNLSAAFRKKFGMSPLEWRRKFNSTGSEHSE